MGSSFNASHTFIIHSIKDIVNDRDAMLKFRDHTASTMVLKAHYTKN